MKTLLSLLILCLYVSAFSQTPLQLRPIVITLDLNEEDAQAFLTNKKKYDAILTKLKDGFGVANLSEEDKAIWDNHDETMEDYWAIIGMGCSWYCGGGPQRVTASSHLKTQGNTTYERATTA